MRVRRTGVCAAFALACSMLYANAAWGVYSREFLNQDDFSVGSREGLTFVSQLGGLTLGQSTNIWPYVWAPSPADSTVSKIDARHGAEVARYKMGAKSEHWAPCAVAPDADGNAYIACAAPNQPAKIVIILAKAGLDRNNDGAIATSSDYDENNNITPSEIFSWGNDEKVGLVCEVGAPGVTPSAMLCDGNGSLFVALKESCTVAKIDIKSGRTVGLLRVVGKPSSMVMSQGSLWVLSTEDRALTRINTKTDIMTSYYNLEFTPGGMCVSSQGSIWVGNVDGGIAALNPAKDEWTLYNPEGAAGVTSVAMGPDGDIWAACPTTATITHFSSIDGSIMSQIPLGKSASSICADADGYMWALCDGDTGAFKIDTRAEKTVATAHTGSAPYSGSAFASSITEKGYLPSGTWHTIIDTRLEGAGWGRLAWKSADSGGRIKMEVRTGDTPQELQVAKFRNVINGEQFGGPNGRFIEIRATFEGPGNMTPTLYAMSIEGRNLPPDVSKAVVNVPRIGRLDHVMESVTVTDIKDPEGDPFKVVITGVTQDEQVAGLGPDDKFPDAILTGGESVWLRGECDPGTPEKPGNGRVYTVAFKATDALGASSTGKLKVTVAPTIKVNDVAIEDKEKFDATKEVFVNVAKAE